MKIISIQQAMGVTIEIFKELLRRAFHKYLTLFKDLKIRISDTQYLGMQVDIKGMDI